MARRPPPRRPPRDRAKTLSLCWGRHPMPPHVRGAIYPKWVDPTDLLRLEIEAEEALKGLYHLDLYVTGLATALCSVIVACYRLRIGLTVWHWDRVQWDYVAQTIFPDWRTSDEKATPDQEGR